MISPLWRFFVAALDGTGITDFSKLASDRVVEVVLNAPLSLEGTVPSDNPQVWIPYDGDGYDDPYLSEGTRLMWGFRRENATPADVYDPEPYTVRAATIVRLVQDEAQEDDATTRFQGWDPWHYMFNRPVVDQYGALPGTDGLTYPANTPVAEIVASLLDYTISYHGHAYIDAGVTYGGTAFWAGQLDTSMVVSLTEDYIIQQGTSVGQAWQDLTAMGLCDIYLEPIYDPIQRPNYLVDLTVVPQLGSIRDEAIFAWNLPGRSLVGISRLEEGATRANNVRAAAGQGASAGFSPTQTDAPSVTKFGEYWAQPFYPAQTDAGGLAAVTSLAAQQLALRKDGRTTVTFRPAPERSPRPWLDYGLGDRVPVWASKEKFRKLLGDYIAGSYFDVQYQRVYGWRLNISDDALETVDPLLTSPQTGVNA